ncbi:MBL fold metallo-hydrolase [Phormidesmis sp. 146-35]
MTRHLLLWIGVKERDRTYALSQESAKAMTQGNSLTLPAGTEPPDFERGSIFFIGTATVILRYAGFTILTDPNFLHQGDHIHLGYGLTSTRQTNPAIDIENLPPIDFVLLSHKHDDHFDRIAEEKLDKGVAIVTTHHAEKSLKKIGFREIYPLDTWDTLTVNKGTASLKITAMPGRHGPGIMSALLPNVMGSMLEFQPTPGDTKFRLYITGDTLVYDQIREIPKRFTNVDLALLHLGGTRAFGILVTMDAQQGVEMIKIISPRRAIPIHFNDYTVFKSPLEEFVQAVEQAGLSDRVHYVSHGDTFAFEVAAYSQSTL